MWYRFSKTNWVWDIPVRAKAPYAYVKADNEREAIKRLNSSEQISRKYDMRGIDSIAEVYHVPIDHVNLVIFKHGDNDG